MELQVTGHNIEILPTVRAYLEKKLAKLNRHLSAMSGIKVELTEQKTKSQAQRFRTQITLEVNGTLLRRRTRQKICWWLLTGRCLPWTARSKGIKGSSIRRARRV